MFYYKRKNSLFALKSEPKKIVEEEIKKDGQKHIIKKLVIDDSFIPITKEEFDRLVKSKQPKINKKN